MPSDTKIQDAGYVDLVDVDYAPPSGWSADGVVEAIPGHSYILLTRDNHYAKFQVVTRGSTSMTMDWAYQIDPDNPELAKKLHGHKEKLARGVEEKSKKLREMQK